MNSHCRKKKLKNKKWKVYSWVLEFIHCFDQKYSPLDNANTETDRINKLMSNFPKIMEAMNEKKQFFIDSYPNKDREFMRRLAFTPNIGASQIIV